MQNSVQLLRGIKMEVTDLIKGITTEDNSKLEKAYNDALLMNNNLIRFDALNRIIIALQSDSVYDLRTPEEWNIDTRKLMKDAKPLYIIAPKYSIKYISTHDGRELKSGELTVDELNKALQYNIVKRDSQLSSLFTIPMYDIKQTVSMIDEKYHVNKPKLSSVELIKIFTGITGSSIELCDSDYYSINEKEAFIKKGDYQEIAEKIVGFLLKYLENTKLDKLKDSDNLTISDYDIDIIKNSLEVSIKTLFGIQDIESIHLKGKYILSDLIALLSIIDSCMIEIESKMKFSSTKTFGDAVESIKNIQKAEVILDLMEANSINRIMKGID